MTSKTLIVALLALTLSACGIDPTLPASSGPPKPELQFVDLQSFDRDLTQSLQAPLPKVDVAFYDKVTPSALPERLQPWMAAVEAGGGSVKVVPPKPALASRSPFLLISAISSIWSASKIAKELALKGQYKTAQAFDAEIQLKLDEKGESVVDKVVFVQRKK